ncbi:hypothetical protein [Pseudomonas protegens]|uniref:hypothetical protein n=1 Tax=Pseudomonas protegens TaxID=380021 RepID=UPI00276A0D20|nr:hypothetical protein [Pseudomonas protegens]MDP9514748.1 hypothetical protein [Pseudomonas protegens]
MSEGTVSVEVSGVLGSSIQLLSAVGWPHSAFVFGLFFTIYFRKDIRSLIGRLTNLGPSGITAAPPLSLVQPEASTEKGLPSAVVNTDHLKEYLFLINKQKEDLEKEISGVDKDGLVGYLTEHLAYVRGLWFFERIFNFIYAGQIVFLRMLNERQGVGIARSDLPMLWEQHQKKLAPLLDSWDGHVYVSYLYAAGLIVDEGDTVKITHIGVEFLMWMTRNGRSESMRTL